MGCILREAKNGIVSKPHVFAPLVAFFALTVAAAFHTPVFAFQDSDEAPLLNHGDGVRNPSFETWVNGAPLFWTRLAGSRENALRTTKESASGESALAVGAGDALVVFAQKIEFSSSVAGMTVRFTVRAKTSEPDAALCYLLTDGGEHINSLPHPGDGEWHELSVKHTFGQRSVPKWIIVALASDRAFSEEALFDDANMEVETAAGD